MKPPKQDDFETLKGPAFTAVGEAVNQVMGAAIDGGLSMEIVASIVVQVAADYMRLQHGSTGLVELAQTVIHRGTMPLPTAATH